MSIKVSIREAHLSISSLQFDGTAHSVGAHTIEIASFDILLSSLLMMRDRCSKR